MLVLPATGSPNKASTPPPRLKGAIPARTIHPPPLSPSLRRAPRVDTSNLPSDSVGARLTQFHQIWVASGAPSWSRETVLRGYHWSWQKPPPFLRVPTLTKQNETVTLLDEKSDRLVLFCERGDP